MSNMPCQNQSCKSYGKSHPNCKCFGGMAEGGEAKSFCSEKRDHRKECKYFAEGGSATLKSGDIIPDDAPDEVIPSLKPGDVIPNDAPDDITDNTANTNAPLKSGDIIPNDAPDDNPYQTNSQKAITAIEGLGRGFLGPLETIASKAGQYFPAESGVPFAEKQLGFTPEDIKAREEANPTEDIAGQGIGLLVGALTGTGAVGLAAKAAKSAAEFSQLGKLGSNVLSGALANGTIQAGDEAGKWLLGQGDQGDAVGASMTNIGAAGLLGGLGGAAGTIGQKILDSLGGNQFIGKLEGTLAGLGAGAKSTYDPDAVSAAEKAGLFDHYDPSFGDVQKYYDMAKNTFQTLFHPHIAGTLAAAEGYREGGFEQAIANLAKVEGVGYGVKGISKYALTPVITKVLESGSLAGLADAIQHGINVANGNNLMDKAIDGVLKGGSTPSIDWFGSEADRLKQRSKLNQHIENGGVNQDIQDMQSPQNPFGYPQSYAQGGSVSTGKEASLIGMNQQYPVQATMMGIARSRVSNYLNNLRPAQSQMGPIFDAPPDQTQQKKNYDKALDIANRPLSILNDVQKGTIEPNQIKHFQTMYPEINQLLQKKLTMKMVEGKMENKKPSYQVRQGLSLLLGTPLSSDLAPQNIQAAQATFAQKAGSALGGGVPVTKNKKNTSSLSKMSSQFSTASQARASEKQSGD